MIDYLYSFAIIFNFQLSKQEKYKQFFLNDYFTRFPGFILLMKFKKM